MMDREAWCATVHRVAKSWTWLSDWTELFYDGSTKLVNTKPQNIIEEDERKSNLREEYTCSWIRRHLKMPVKLICRFNAFLIRNDSCLEGESQIYSEKV